MHTMTHTMRRVNLCAAFCDHGKVLHEMVLGTREAIQAHVEMMKKFPGMEHDDANMAHVKPGKAGEIVWQFSRAGEFQFACLLPGHFEWPAWSAR
jgi:uncharacterized cupredoxin-like copper-binding protein